MDANKQSRVEESINYARFVFDNAIEHLENIKEIVSSNTFNEIVDDLCSSRIWTIGMGKASLAAKKLASTLACFGIPAAFIHPGEALHGDFGSIQSGDVVVAFSNSGKTEEAMKVIEKAHQYAKVVLISGSCDGVGTLADNILYYGDVEEACPLGLTPTTSTIIMMAIADALAIAVQVRIGLTYEQYANNHHAGYLGQISRNKASL